MALERGVLASSGRVGQAMAARNVEAPEWSKV